MIRGVELGRRAAAAAAAGSCRGRAREEFADWEARRLRKSRGVLGSVGTGAREEHGRSMEAHGKTRELGGSWRVQGGTRRKHGNKE